MLAGDHQGIAAGKFVRIDVTAARYAMNVLRVDVSRRGLCGFEGFSFSLGESLFSFHRSLRHGRMRRRVGAVIRGSRRVSKGERQTPGAKSFVEPMRAATSLRARSFIGRATLMFMARLSDEVASEGECHDKPTSASG